MKKSVIYLLCEWDGEGLIWLEQIKGFTFEFEFARNWVMEKPNRSWEEREEIGE